MKGFPEGYGQDLADFLSEISVVNGMRLGGLPSWRKSANGPGCLAAQLVDYFKDDAGGIYLETCDGEPGDYMEEYIYTVYPKEDEDTYISIYDVYSREVIFVGTSLDLQTKYDIY